MRRIITLSAILALVLSGCTKDGETATGSLSAGPLTINATIGDDATKVAMDDNGSSVSYNWKKGDKIFFVNISDCADTVVYKLSSGEGTASGVFGKSSGEFKSGSTYVFCHIGNGVRIGASGELTDKDGKPVLKGQNPVHVENYMVFAGYSGAPKSYSFTFDGSNVPSSIGFEAPFTILKAGVMNSSSAAITPTGIRLDGGKGSGYFLGTLKLDTSKGITATGAVDAQQVSIWDGEAVEAGAQGAYPFICVQNPGRSFNSLRLSVYYN